MAESAQLNSARICIAQGWYVFPTVEREKRPDHEFCPHGFKDASLDPRQIEQWWTAKPQAGIGIDLGRSNLTILDFDNGEPPVSLNLPETLQVATSRGTHCYFSGLCAQGNMFVEGVHCGEIKSSGGYVLGPFSLHPSGATYTVKLSRPVAPLPVEIIEKLRGGKLASAPPTRNEQNLIVHGQIHNSLVAQAGRLRNAMGEVSLETFDAALLEWAYANCAQPLDDNKIHAVAQNTFASFKPGQGRELIMSSVPVSMPVNASVVATEDLPVFDDVGYPKFPHYVMTGTSLYEGFVKPVCDVNSRIDYFMWLPAMQLLLNYVGPKIKIRGPLGVSAFRGSIYSVIIGKKGKSNKSSSVEDAIDYFKFMGVLGHYGKDTTNAEGKTLVWTVGSPEGLGIDMQKSNCKNALLYYDELSKLLAKSGIESSGLVSDLLTMYEAGKFANSVKDKKSAYSLDPGSYCTTMITCTTDRKFGDLWSRLAGEDTGLNDRFMFILQPEKLPAPRAQEFVNTLHGSTKTRQLIDRAVQKGEFAFDDKTRNHPEFLKLVETENRLAVRAEKWAVAFAVDLGLDSVDDECMERATEIVKYEMAVKAYLKPYDSTDRESKIQLGIRHLLEQNKGRMEKREVERKMNSYRISTFVWKSAWEGLKSAGIMREEGTGERGNPIVAQLLRKIERAEED
jgi:hypothetical protein